MTYNPGKEKTVRYLVITEKGENLLDKLAKKVGLNKREKKRFEILREALLKPESQRDFVSSVGSSYLPYKDLSYKEQTKYKYRSMVSSLIKVGCLTSHTRV